MRHIEMPVGASARRAGVGRSAGRWRRSHWPWWAIVAGVLACTAPRPVAADEAPWLPADMTATQLPSDAELDDSWARVLLRANPGPFHYLSYEVTVRGPAGVVSHVRGFMGRGDVVTRTELVPKAEVRRLFGYLRDLGALEWSGVQLPWSAPSPPAPAKAKAKRGKAAAQAGLLEAGRDPSLGPERSVEPVVEVSFRLGGREKTLLLPSPLTLADRRYARFIEVLRAVAIRATGEIGYHAPLGQGGTAGYLFIDSQPSAQVTVDGVTLTDTTPILAYAVAPGVHTVVLENKRLGLRRETKVRVQAGLTTSVELELK